MEELRNRSGVTHPNSTMPSANSFFVNSHCVAALNFQAMIKTFRLTGSTSRSSQNFAIPSAIILSSSDGSKTLKSKKIKMIYLTTCYNIYEWFLEEHVENDSKSVGLEKEDAMN